MKHYQMSSETIKEIVKLLNQQFMKCGEPVVQFRAVISWRTMPI